MNKKIFLLALPAILLTSCNLIEFSDESHDEGFSDGQERKERTVEYFDGDNLSEFEESQISQFSTLQLLVPTHLMHH